ncbi:MAG: DinB family protein [Planctomycetota bacterium]
MEFAELRRNADDALAEAENLLDHPNLRTPRDGWNAAQHLEHLSIAAVRSLKAVHVIQAGQGETREGKADVIGRRILRSGRIPAGAEAPQPTRPTEEGDLDRARANLATCRGWLAELPPTGLADGAMPHPLLGLFDGNEWLRFVAVHTRHHLALIDDLDAPPR